MPRHVLLDFRFEEVPQDLATLKDCLQLVERGMPNLIKAEKERIWQEWGTDEDADRSVGHFLEGQLDEGVTTRFITAAFVVALWALYEAAVLKYADYIRKAKKLTLKLRDLRGDFLEQGRKYFEEVLHFDLHPVTADWVRLGMLGKLRNALAHANGRLEDLSEPNRGALEQWVSKQSNLKVADDSIVVTFDFARQSWAFMNDLLDDLHKRVRATF
jgi:hypothetical protein